MDYEKFYDIATFGNENWKGSFTPKEIACNAYDYLCEFEVSKNGHITSTIQELARLLAEDGSNLAKEWLWNMATELNLIDMDYADYFETDEWMKSFLSY